MNRGTIKLLTLIIMALSIAGITSCDDDPEPSGRDAVLTGEFEDAFFYSNLTEPDTFLNDNIHRTTREVELDGEQGADLLIIAEMDTVLDAMNRPMSATKRLSIAAPDNADPVSVAITGFQDVRSYGKAQFITFNNTAWLLLDENKITLASSEQDLSSGQSIIVGEWNGLTKQYMGILLQRDGKELISWVELSVLSFDNHVFHNSATFELE